MKLRLDATAQELSQVTHEELTQRIEGAVEALVREALGTSPSCCGDPLHKARGARGGEIDLVMDLASQMRGAYEQRLTALQSDLDALVDKVDR